MSISDVYNVNGCNMMPLEQPPSARKILAFTCLTSLGPHGQEVTVLLNIIVDGTVRGSVEGTKEMDP